MTKAKKQAVKKKITEKKSVDTTRVVRLLMAGWVTGMLFLQLFGFEKMPSVLYASGVDGALAYVLLIALALSELLSLPFWLGMKLPKEVIQMSIVAAVVSLFMLAVLETMAYLSGQTMFLGAALDLPGGEWSLSFMAAIVVLGAWGMLSGKKPKSYALTKK